MSACTHKIVRTISEGAYMGSVAVYPHTDENRAAHGNITVTVECRACGAQRRENINQSFLEVGPWGPDRVTRERQER